MSEIDRLGKLRLWIGLLIVAELLTDLVLLVVVEATLSVLPSIRSLNSWESLSTNYQARVIKGVKLKVVKLVFFFPLYSSLGSLDL